MWIKSLHPEEDWSIRLKHRWNFIHVLSCYSRTLQPTCFSQLRSPHFISSWCNTLYYSSTNCIGSIIILPGHQLVHSQNRNASNVKQIWACSDSEQEYCHKHWPPLIVDSKQTPEATHSLSKQTLQAYQAEAAATLHLARVSQNTVTYATVEIFQHRALVIKHMTAMEVNAAQLLLFQWDEFTHLCYPNKLRTVADERKRSLWLIENNVQWRIKWSRALSVE